MSVHSTGRRVALRPPAAADTVSVEPWLPEAVAAVQGRGGQTRPGLTLPSLREEWQISYPGGETLLGAPGGDAPIGVLRVRPSGDGRLLIDALAVRADARNLGYGQEMVLAAEERATAWARSVVAGVPRANGLAVYFWLRTGYRPLYPVAAPLPPTMNPALLWMVRALG